MVLSEVDGTCLDRKPGGQCNTHAGARSGNHSNVNKSDIKLLHEVLLALYVLFVSDQWKSYSGGEYR